MKLYKRETVVDPFTFEPLMRLTIDIPIEALHNKRLTQEEISYILGGKFIEILKDSDGM